MKILIYRWKAYNYEDIIECFKQMGFQVDEIAMQLLSYDIDEQLAEILRKQLLENEYNFVFTVNYFGLISDVCQDIGIPYVCWACDNPLISMYHESVFNSVNRIFLMDLTSVAEFRGMGVENVWHLPLAVNCDRLDYEIAHCDKNYSGDVAFVGSLYEKNSYDKMKYTMSDYLQGYFEATMEAQRDLQGVNIVERMLTPDILEQLEESFKLEKTDRSFSDLGLIFSVTTLGFKIAQLQRRTALIELSKKHQVNLYTESNTEDLIRVSYRGPVNYWTEMPRVFHDSRINLNMTIPNIKVGIPLRCFDVLGSGGFLLTNYQAELPKLFELDRDLVCYYSQEDMIEKVDYYLSHESERIEIAEKGYKKVKENCRYEDRIAKIMEKI